ncbi:putative Superoxide dismutase [Blattamonas nauphoetae]|uniref:Superoxide dismutase n=1 Tax=Blattamonas nauphoetae TaxID=2049346 RepID=A0ABQ9XB89_9EUKA|nr:putative Superoxide dismutase [Blattamonas nauphoetae]
MSAGNYKLNEGLLAKMTAKPMEGISENLLKQHFDLYKGYVTNANNLLKELSSGAHTGQAAVDRRRRLGFEVNGVIMHELFFENLSPENTTPGDQVKAFFSKYYGSWEKFIAELENAGGTRGVGWVAVMFDKLTDTLTTTWVEEHHLGMLANMEPLLLVDCWEHAFIVDFGSTGRGNYVKTLLKHIDWEVVCKRIVSAEGNLQVVRCVQK